MTNNRPSPVFPDLEAVKTLWKNGDLSEEQRIFPYYASKADEKAGRVTWVHRDALKNMALLDSVYPSSGNRR